MVLAIVLSFFAAVALFGQRAGAFGSGSTIAPVGMAAVQVLGIQAGQPNRPRIGATPSASTVATPPPPGPLTPPQPVLDPVTFCAPGAHPSFSDGFASLREALGDVMGEPIQCAHVLAPDGDIAQNTTRGLALYRPRTNVPSFTNGWHHWAITERGLVEWDGDAIDPPPAE